MRFPFCTHPRGCLLYPRPESGGHCGAQATHRSPCFPHQRPVREQGAPAEFLGEPFLRPRRARSSLEWHMSRRLGWDCCGRLRFSRKSEPADRVNPLRKTQWGDDESLVPSGTIEPLGSPVPESWHFRTLSLEVMESPFIPAGFRCVPVTGEGDLLVWSRRLRCSGSAWTVVCSFRVPLPLYSVQVHQED